MSATTRPRDTARPTSPSTERGIGLRGWLRWTWRQLTSMRVAILLLLALAVVSLPGSFFPQRSQDPGAVMRFEQDNPAAAVWLDRLGMFEVYSSPWFSAVYILLFVSLIGCIVPRTAVYVRTLRQGPSAVPRRLTRFPARVEGVSEDDPETVAARLQAHLRRGDGVVRRTDLAPAADDAGRVPVIELSAERGRLHEAGNLLFHVALVGVLLAFGAGQLLSYRGQALVIEGESFANSVLDYDSFTAGAFLDAGDMEPFTLRLENFSSQFTVDGQPRDFRAQVRTRAGGQEPEEHLIRVNHPLNLDDTRVYLSGNGYAPVLTVRDASGEVALSGPVPFLPQNPQYISNGVIKVPDTSHGQPQLGILGVLLPTASTTPDGSLTSLHPAPEAPAIVLQVWEGDLGLDEGIPQNVYQLDTERMTQVTGTDGAPDRLVLTPGQTVELPGGRGSITYESTARFASFDLRHDPTLFWLGATSLSALAGLAVSLGVTRRRVWVRLSPGPDGTGTHLEVAGLARGEDLGLEAVVQGTYDAGVAR